MLERTERISFRIFSVLSKVEPEPDLHTGSDQKVPAPTSSGFATLVGMHNNCTFSGTWLAGNFFYYG